MTAGALEIPREVADWIERGRGDVALFALNGLGIDFHAAQIEAATASLDGQHQYYELHWANRAGKTTLVDVLHLHRLFYKLGVDPARPGDDADFRRWLAVDYRTLHVAPLNRLSGRAHIAAADILKGVSEAQRDRALNEYREAPLAPFFSVTRERIETGADKMFLRCITGGVTEFDTTEGGGGRLEGVAYRFITWDEWPQQEAADKGEAIRTVLTRLTNRASDFDAAILLTGTITPETEHIAKEWMEYAADLENPDWWGNSASRDLNPSASSKALERALRTLTEEDYARTVLGMPGGVRGRVLPSMLLDPMFDPTLPVFTAKEEGFTYVAAWDIALTTADNVGIVGRVPEDWLFSPERPIQGVRLKILPGSRTLTSAEIIHTIEETYLPYGGRIVIDTTDAHGLNIYRELRRAGYPVEDFDFHGRDRRSVIRKDAAIHNLRAVLGEGLVPTRDRTGEIVHDVQGVPVLDQSVRYGSVRFPSGWTKVKDQLAVLREDDQRQRKDAAMAALMLIDTVFRIRRAKTHRDVPQRFAVFAGREYGRG